MKKFLAVVEPGELIRYAGALPPLPPETVTLAEALGRVLAEDVAAGEDLPSFRRSTMDGYAVRGQDTTGASASSPGYLACVGEILIGRPAGLDIAPGECCRIPTGGMLPDSADAVLMVEYTRELPGGLVEAVAAVAPGENVVQPGEDAARGVLVLTAGTILRPQEIGILAGLGRVRVAVRRRPRVAILSTGDELVEPSAVPPPGCVRNVNQHSLMAHALDCGAQVRLLGIAPDVEAEIERRLREGLAWADVALVSGGSSVGLRDLTAEIINRLGEPGVVFHGVAVRPGKPTILGRVGDKFVFGLPGHPISAMVSFLNFVRPALLALAGAAGHREVLIPARLTDNIHSRPGREDYVQVTLGLDREGHRLATPIFKKSGMVTSMVRADGYLVIPMACEGLEKGEEVRVHPYQAVLR